VGLQREIARASAPTTLTATPPAIASKISSGALTT